jgi:hypothetical protein
VAALGALQASARSSRASRHRPSQPGDASSVPASGGGNAWMPGSVSNRLHVGKVSSYEIQAHSDSDVVSTASVRPATCVEDDSANGLITRRPGAELEEGQQGEQLVVRTASGSDGRLAAPTLQRELN